jgi:tetratricopeptide (TPR) repeat protein
MGKRWLMIVLVAASAKLNYAIAQGEQGKIVNCKGKVEHNPAAQQAWKPAKVFQNLFIKDKVRTFVASRSDILLVNEAQVKLGPDALLTVQLVQDKAEAKQMNLTLQQGKVWIRTKNATAGQLAVNTTEGRIKVTGTEINVEIRPGNETVLTVIEGSAEISNNRGSLTVNAGEEASARPGVPPTKRRILNPEDAVQWALYYPISFPWNDLPLAAKSGAARIGFERLRQGEARGALNAFTPLFNTDMWARIGASMAYVELGELERAREILIRGGQGRNGVTHSEVETALHTQLAAVALASGDHQTAMRELLQVLRTDPKSLRALTLLSSVKLTQNRKQVALKLASAAVRAHPKSVAALIAASEAAQAYFNLEVAEKLLDRALALDPEEVHALVNRARIRFGSGNTKRAKEDAERAAAIAPADAQVLSLTGFIKLAEGDLNSATEYFKNAIESDTDLGEPHLGLGLVFFRQDRINEGLLEMLTASLLEPKVSLYQSYLGKAYYQLRRFKEGLSALETAKRLDSHDPTPWLYSSFFLRDLNQQVEALNELRRAIALNDNRAVYRSRFLLDRDLATKNVSLAQVYRQLGFEAWGASEALNSLNSDITNASAHIFLAQTYGSLPDRAQAQGSELLQYFLYAPVNRNSFNSFNEYTALLDQPRRQLFTFEEIGNADHKVVDVGLRGGNERFAYNSFFSYEGEQGARLDKLDTRIQGFGQGKLALRPETDVFISLNLSDYKFGDPEDIALTIGPNTPNSFEIKRLGEKRDPNKSFRVKTPEGTLGIRHNWRAGSTFTAMMKTEEIRHTLNIPDVIIGYIGNLPIFGDLQFESPFRTYDLQVQQVTPIGKKHQLIAGAEGYKINKQDLLKIEYVNPLLNQTVIDTVELKKATDRGLAFWLQDEIEFSPRLHATIGMRYHDDQVRILSADTTLSFQQFNAMFGLSLRLSASTVLRTAAFRRLNSRFVGETISPTAVAGFVLDRNDLPFTDRKEADVSLEHEGNRLFQVGQIFYRDVKVPRALGVGIEKTRALGFNYNLNLILNHRLSLFTDNQLVRIKTAHFTLDDNQIRLGLNFIHPQGFFARVANTYVIQRFTDTDFIELENTSYNLTDVEFKHEFANKHGVVTIKAANLFDRHFKRFIEGLSVPQQRPTLHAILTFDWRF